MKNIRDLTEEQILEIAKLALSAVLSFDTFAGMVQQGPNLSPVQLKVEHDLYDKKEKLMVIRVYAHGLGDTWCAIWEDTDENKIDVTVVEDKNPADVSNMVLIVKKLIEWGFV